VRGSIRRGPARAADALPLEADPAAVRRRWATVWAILGLPGLTAVSRGGAPAASGPALTTRTRDGPPEEARGGGSPPRRRPRPGADRSSGHPQRQRRRTRDTPAARETHEVR
jgi:hypothetical protein